MNLVGFLVAVLIAVVVMYVLWLFVGWMKLPEPVRQIVLLIVGLLLLLFVLSQLGVLGRGVVFVGA